MKKTYEEKVRIYDLSLAGMKCHALASYPYECCGFLFGHRDQNGQIRITDAIPLHNQENSGNSYRRYEVDPVSAYKMERAGEKRGLEVIGIYHSHPDKEAVLSLEDEDRMIPGQVYVILSVSDRKCRGIRAWRRPDPEAGVNELKIKHEVKTV